MYLALWLIRRWRLPAGPERTLPVAVILNRFFTPLLVLSFCLAISNPPYGEQKAASAWLLAGRAWKSQNWEGRAGSTGNPAGQWELGPGRAGFSKGTRRRLGFKDLSPMNRYLRTSLLAAA